LSVLLLASLAVLAAAIVGSVLVTTRTGETRVALLTGLLTLLAVQQGVALAKTWGAPLAFDLATASALAGLGIGLLGLLSVFALSRTLAELERAESIHWESMEGVRGLTDLASRREVAMEERLPALLAMGCDRLGLEIGLVSRVSGGRYEVSAIHAPESFPIRAGTAFDLADTICAATLASERPVAASSAEDVHWLTNPTRDPFHFEAYLACAIRVHGESRGTLVFASLEPRTSRFTASHKDLLVLMAQWIGTEQERLELARAEQDQTALAETAEQRRLDAEQELERSRVEVEQERQQAEQELERSRVEVELERQQAEQELERRRHEAEQELARSRVEAAQEVERSRREAEQERGRREAAERSGPVAAALRRARRRVTGGPRTLDLNATVARLERRIRRHLPKGVELQVEKASDLAEAQAPRLPLDAIVTSLVRRAAEAMPEGGTVTVSTANHDSAVADPGVMQAVSPARYVTLSVAESSGAVDAEVLDRAFVASEDVPTPGSDAEGGLPLATVYRLLQRVGGDLSVEVEPGRGSRFVAFLPLPADESRSPSADAMPDTAAAGAAPAQPGASAAPPASSADPSPRAGASRH